MRLFGILGMGTGLWSTPAEDYQSTTEPSSAS
jgi:hypothetical protein